ncbi:hypothetical protein A4A49_16512 [Nicotiana attenuata]|uniref:Uncharacterized protein n=1 Tax=Nicotiana attenuata TaxID=49451 RepID=A0A314L2L9_NICAT|nr:hypothetical protein A4A49_16512 [Nicotiana attenuata]
MGCAEHCPSSSQGCTRTCSSTPLMPIHLQCQQPVMNVIVNAPTTIVIYRNNTYSGNGNGNGPAAAAANGGLIPLPIFQQLQQPMAQNRFPLSPLSIRRRAGDVAGTSHEQAAPPPRNGSAPQPSEQASIYPESNLELSLEANSTYDEEHPPAAAAANGGLIPLPIFQQLQQPMAQNRFPLSPLSIRRRAGDVAGTSHEQAAPPPRNGSAPQPNEQASIYPESNLELSLEANSTYNEEHPFLCQRLESLNLERLHPIDEASEDEEEEDKIRYPNLIHFF